MKEEAWTYLIFGEVQGNKLIVTLAGDILATFDITNGGVEAAAGQAYAYLTTHYSSFQLPISIDGKRVMNLLFGGLSYYAAEQEYQNKTLEEYEAENPDDYADFRAAETMMTVKEASQVLRVTPRRVQAMVNAGLLPKSQKIGRDWLLDKDEVKELATRERPAHRPSKSRD